MPDLLDDLLDDILAGKVTKPAKTTSQNNAADVDDLINGEHGSKVKGLFDTVKWAEGGRTNLIVGGKLTFDPEGDHPNIVGLTTDAGGSTAAGDYQITGSNWYGANGQPGLKTRLGAKNFNADNQLRAAVMLANDGKNDKNGNVLRRRGEFSEAVKNGNYDRARTILAQDWTSTPGSKIGGGGQKKIEDWQKKFDESLGVQDGKSKRLDDILFSGGMPSNQQLDNILDGETQSPPLTSQQSPQPDALAALQVTKNQLEQDLKAEAKVKKKLEIKRNLDATKQEIQAETQRRNSQSPNWQLPGDEKPLTPPSPTNPVNVVPSAVKADEPKTFTRNPKPQYQFEADGKSGDNTYLGIFDGKHYFKNPDGDEFVFDETTKQLKPTAPLKRQFDSNKNEFVRRDDKKGAKGETLYSDKNGDDYVFGDDGSITPASPFTQTITLKNGKKLTRTEKLANGAKYADENNISYIADESGFRLENPPRQPLELSDKKTGAQYVEQDNQEGLKPGEVRLADVKTGTDIIAQIVKGADGKESYSLRSENTPANAKTNAPKTANRKLLTLGGTVSTELSPEQLAEAAKQYQPDADYQISEDQRKEREKQRFFAEKPSVEADKIGGVSKGNAGTVSVDLSKKPKGENADDFLTRSALMSEGAKFDLTTAEIDDFVKNRTDRNSEFSALTDDDIKRFADPDGTYKVPVNILNSVINQILQKRTGGDPNDINPALQTQIGLDENQLGGLEKNQENIATFRREDEAEAQTRAEIEQSIKNPSFKDSAERGATKGFKFGIDFLVNPIYGIYTAATDAGDFNLSDEDKDKLIQDKINEIPKEFGSYSEYRKVLAEAEKIRTDDYAPWLPDTPDNWLVKHPEWGVRMLAGFGRGLVNQVVSSNLKGIDLVDKLVDFANPLSHLADQKEGAVRALNYLPYNARNLANIFGLVTATMLGKADQFRASTQSADVDKRLLYTVGQRLQDYLGDDKYLNKDFSYKIAQGLGSAAGFMLIGMVAPEVSIESALGELSVTSGISGAISQAGDAYGEARQAGLSEGKSLVVGGANLPLGATEMFGVGSTLQRALSETEKHAFFEFIKENIVHESLEEAVQEFFQTTNGKVVMDAMQDKDPSAWNQIKNALARLPKQAANTLVNEVPSAALTGGLFGGAVGGATHLAERSHSGSGVKLDEKSNSIVVDGERFSFEPDNLDAVKKYKTAVEALDSVREDLETAAHGGDEDGGAIFNRELKILQARAERLKTAANLTLSKTGEVAADEEITSPSRNEIEQTPAIETEKTLKDENSSQSEAAPISEADEQNDIGEKPADSSLAVGKTVEYTDPKTKESKQGTVEKIKGKKVLVKTDEADVPVMVKADNLKVVEPSPIEENAPTATNETKKRATVNSPKLASSDVRISDIKGKSGKAQPFEFGKAENLNDAQTDDKEIASSSIVSFKTSKGSVYTVDGNSTERDKSFHPEHGKDDVGKKEKSEITYYAENADSLSKLVALEADKKRVVIEKQANGDIYALPAFWNEKEGKLGVTTADRANPVKLTTAPQKGLSPVELWKSEIPQNGTTAYRGLHVGNPIVEIETKAETGKKSENLAVSENNGQKNEKSTQTRKVKVNGFEIELTPEQNERWANEVEPLEAKNKSYNESQEKQATLAEQNGNSRRAAEIRDDAGRRAKGDAIQLSALKREIANVLTVKEQAKKLKREKSNYPGKGVSVDGQNATVVGAPYGNVTVKFADGSQTTVAKEKISPPIEEKTADAKSKKIDQSSTSEKTPEYRFSSTQANLAGRMKEKILTLGKSLIDTRDLSEDGREAQPHLTVLYGIHQSHNEEDVRRILASVAPFEITLGKVSIFKGKKDADYDVVKVEVVDSPELIAVNKLLAENLNNTQDFPDYKPHITLGYVKKGLGVKYAGSEKLAGQKIEFDEIAFSDKQGAQTPIKLLGKNTGEEIKAEKIIAENYTFDDYRKERKETFERYGAGRKMHEVSVKGQEVIEGNPDWLPYPQKSLKSGDAYIDRETGEKIYILRPDKKAGGTTYSSIKDGDSQGAITLLGFNEKYKRDTSSETSQINEKTSLEKKLDEIRQTKSEKIPDERKRDYGTIDKPNAKNLAQAFADQFKAGKGFSTIVEARKFASNLLGGRVEGGTAQEKQIQEIIELGVVQRAREIAATEKDAGKAFDQMVALYNLQPNLAGRTSTSISQQAYSTPAPLGFLASRLAGINESTSVYEPTAGNGMLLMEANPNRVTANELNADRFQSSARRASGRDTDKRRRAE